MARDPRQILQYLDTYFGTRNGIKGSPIENVNYTIETLTYMTPKARGDEIANIIVDKIKGPFGVFECCAGIGGNTLSFLENPAVQWVVSYELLPERREMLRRNLAMYGFDKTSRVFVQEEGFNGVPATYPGTVLYFDPPWLPSHIKGHESTKEDYVLHGIKIGDKTLEQWLEACKHCALIAMRVPPGYKLDPIPGFTYDQMLIGPKQNSLLILAKYNPTTLPLPPLQPVPVVPVQPVVQKQTNDYNKWYEGLKNYLFNNILKSIVPSEEHRLKMVSPEAMAIWVPCFTHKSFDPNIGNNYEELETVGDKELAYVFVLYLYLNYPKMTSQQLSELKSSYMSKPAQAQMTLNLGLEKWVRARNIEINTHIFEDIMESFFGGLTMVGDTVFKFGAGHGLCYSMINKIFEETKIDMKYAKGKPKTQIKEMFEQLHWGKAQEDFEENQDRSTTATVSLAPEAVESIRSLGVNLQTPVLAREVGTTKTVASDNAYQVALDRIRAMGFTEEWVKLNRGNRDLKNPELTPYIDPVQRKLKAEGYVGFYIAKPQMVRDGKYFQLIGIRPDNHLVILAGTDEPMSENDGRKTVLTKYLNNQQ